MIHKKRATISQVWESQHDKPKWSVLVEIEMDGSYKEWFRHDGFDNYEIARDIAMGFMPVVYVDMADAAFASQLVATVLGYDPAEHPPFGRDRGVVIVGE